MLQHVGRGHCASMAEWQPDTHPRVTIEGAGCTTQPGSIGMDREGKSRAETNHPIRVAH